jgi:transcription elongation GreA/GreB family factor
MSAMTHTELLEQLNSLPAAERLKIVESTVHELREDLERSSVQAREETSARLARAAEALLGDYSNDRELTALTALDSEAFHA